MSSANPRSKSQSGLLRSLNGLGARYLGSRIRRVRSYESGIPGSLVRRNPEIQAVVSRSRLSQVDWTRVGLSGSGKLGVELFLDTPYDDFMFVACGRGRRRLQDLADLKILRSEGIALED